MMKTKTWQERLSARLTEPHYGREAAMKEEIAELRSKLQAVTEALSELAQECDIESDAVAMHNALKLLS